MPAALSLFAAVAVALVASGAGAAGGAPDRAITGEPSIELTVDNWGAPVSVLDPAHPAWGRVALSGGPQIVTLTIATNGGRFLGYAAQLTAPDAPGEPEVFHCSDENHVIESRVICQFEVAMAAGANRLDVVFQALNQHDSVSAHGVVRAGELGSRTGLQVRQPDGRWINVANGGRSPVRAALTGAVRYVVLNTGQIPFRVVGSCSQTALNVDGVLVCQLRGQRPGIALGGHYRVPIHLVDAAGGTDTFTIDVAIDVTGAFRS